MKTVADLVKALDGIAPFDLAFSFDKVGLQVGDASSPASRVLVTLDRSLAAVARAVEIGAQAVVSHHPLLFHPLGSVLENDHVGRTVRELVRNDVALIAYHTNWDMAGGGVNDALASVLGLADVDAFGSGPDRPWHRLSVDVPATHADDLAEALAKAGAGRLGGYEGCSFRVAGEGHFTPLPGARPAFGVVGVPERVAETRLDVLVAPSGLGRVLAALRAEHPYEEPSHAVTDVRPPHRPAGRVGGWSPCSSAEAVARIETALGTRCDLWGAPDVVARVAVIGGAAAGDWRAARAAGADLFVTGEILQHVALEAAESGLAVLQAGHYATEQPGMEALTERLREAAWETELFVPEPGLAGRPDWSRASQCFAA